jgi:hypothetical protein
MGRKKVMQDPAEAETPSTAPVVEAPVAPSSDEPAASEVDAPKKAGTVSRRKDGRNYVQKNSLTEAELISAREEIRASVKRKSKEEISEEDRYEDRRVANRLSAFQSRQRRKKIIEDLQKTVEEQANHNTDQAKRILDLSKQLQVARQEGNILRHQLSGTGQSMPAGANPLLQMTPNPMTLQFQQNQLLQSAMLQNALFAQAQGVQQNTFNLLKDKGTGMDPKTDVAGAGEAAEGKPEQGNALSKAEKEESKTTEPSSTDKETS